jgi:galactonate dehydratase
MRNQPGRLGISRREMLASAGLAATGWMMVNDAAGGDNPGVNVEDRGSSIRITGLKTYPIGGTRVLIKVETNREVFGWGEISQLVPKAAVALVESMFSLLDGENPTRVEYLWQKLYRAHRDFRGGAFMIHTISAIDMALWDIAGKLYGVPVYRLLGGPCRDKIRVYPTSKATKTGAGGPYPYSGDAKDIQSLVNRVKDARKQVGPEGTVMFDAHGSIPPAALGLLPKI